MIQKLSIPSFRSGDFAALYYAAAAHSFHRSSKGHHHQSLIKPESMGYRATVASDHRRMHSHDNFPMARVWCVRAWIRIQQSYLKGSSSTCVNLLNLNHDAPKQSRGNEQNSYSQSRCYLPQARKFSLIRKTYNSAIIDPSPASSRIRETIQLKTSSTLHHQNSNGIEARDEPLQYNRTSNFDIAVLSFSVNFLQSLRRVVRRRWSAFVPP